MNAVKRLKQRLTQPLTQDMLTLEHQRIFIVPSAGGLFYLAALLVMLVTAINYQNSLAYALSFWLVSLGLISLFLTWRNLAGLKVKSLPSEGVFCGQAALVNLELQDKRPHYGIELWLKEQKIALDVLAHQPATVRFSSVTDKRGRFAVGRIKIQSLYPFGLFRVWSWVSPAHQLTVYPTPLDGPMPCAASADAGDLSEHASAQGLADFQGLRTYQPGDSLSRIHWQSLGKGQSVQSKTFGVEGFAEQHLDLGSAVGDLESRLSLVCHWVLVLARQGSMFSLTANGRTLGPAQGSEHVQACLEVLADA